MEERKRNWLKVSMLTIHLAPDVLRQLLSTIAQAPFLNDSEYLWFETLQQIKNTNCAASLLLRFTKDMRDKDKTCRRILRSLVMSWRSTIGKMMTWSEQVDSFVQWEEDIKKHYRSCPSNVKEILSSWYKQIQDTIRTLDSMPTCLREWTKELLQLFQQYRQDLQRQTEKYDNFILSSKHKLKSWESMKKRKLMKVITELESDRQKMLKAWKMESETYFQAVGQTIRGRLTSWSQSTIIPEWKKLLDDFETEASEMDDTTLQLSCRTWHEELHNLFDKWLKEIEEVKHDVLLRKSPMKDLEHFPSIRSQQVKDFIISVGENKKQLQTQLSKQQQSTLFPSFGIPNLNECDITLLSILLKSCLVYPPMKGWNDDPPKNDKSVGADILRLQSVRREIIMHVDDFGFDTLEFVKLWRDIKDVLCRLACRSGDEYMNEVCKKVDQIKSLSINELIRSDVYNILKVCRNDIKAELNGILTHRKYKEMKKLKRRVKRANDRIKKSSGRADSSSDSEGSESSSDSGRADSSSDSEGSESSSDSGRADSSSDSEGSESSSDSGKFYIHPRRHSPFKHK